MAIDKDVLDQLVSGREPQELFAKEGLIDELKKALSERMLSAELDDHLESEGAEGAIIVATARRRIDAEWRRIATRYGKLAPNFLGLIKLASIMPWLK